MIENDPTGRHKRPRRANFYDDVDTVGYAPSGKQGRIAFLPKQLSEMLHLALGTCRLLLDLMFRNLSRPETSQISDSELQSFKRMLETTMDLTEPFWSALQTGVPQRIKSVLDRDFPVNDRNPQTGDTALHFLAAHDGRPAIRLLLKHPDVDFLIRDDEGRLASELAYLYGRDPALARLLGNKERKQAERQGITLTRRPQV